jgi:predicted metal-dependent phosphotriesterase family hydrolase
VQGLARTVLGEVRGASLGACNYHEHLFQTSPLLKNEELDDEAASCAEAESLGAAGTTAMVEATPTGLGRWPEAVARISLATGLHVVHVTGAHRDEHYPANHWLTQCSEDDLVRRFSSDIIDGLPADDLPERGPVALAPGGDPIRAGMTKAGIGYWRISSFERRVLIADARVAEMTGVPVMVHLEYCSAAWEVLAALGEAGLPPDRVVLAHADRNLDPGLHAELTLAGSYLGYDGAARHREAPDSAILNCLEKVLASGDPSRIVLGGDVARRSRYRSYGGLPGLDYLQTRFVPRLRAQVGSELTQLLLVANPAALLTLRN